MPSTFQAREFVTDVDAEIKKQIADANPYDIAIDKHSDNIVLQEALTDDEGVKFVTWIFKDGSAAYATADETCGMRAGSEGYMEFMELFVELLIRDGRAQFIQDSTFLPSSKTLH